MGELVGRTDHELVEGVAVDQVRLAYRDGRRGGRRAGSASQRLPRPVSPPVTLFGWGHPVVFGDLELDREGTPRAGFDVPQNRSQEVVLEPFLVIAVRRSQTNPVAFDAEAFDGPNRYHKEWFEDNFLRSIL